MLVTFCTGVFIWLGYGIFIYSVLRSLAILVTFILAIGILILKIRPGHMLS